jgi:hypothetical protein
MIPLDCPPGTAVVLRDDLGQRWNTRTRSRPWTSPSMGRMLVCVEGRAGGYDAERLTPGNDPALRHFRDRNRPTPAVSFGGGA